MSDFVTEFGELLAGAGGQDYLGEAVTIATHSLQAGGLAKKAGAPDALIAAALLHDVGHFFEKRQSVETERHDLSGADWLSTWFGWEVTEPVRLHVKAKRYLCAVEPSYFDRLSPASVYTLSWQGGPMSADEVAEFETNPFHVDAVAVRRWDDEAKDPDADTPDYAVFAPILTRLAS
ncbi:MAG TPA: HD domain-containing protein [Pseudonocardiaceae bacterium]|nr:HD domain-containing protein [Pseudonocardiaceae bacterium]